MVFCYIFLSDTCAVAQGLPSLLLVLSLCTRQAKTCLTYKHGQVNSILYCGTAAATYTADGAAKCCCAVAHMVSTPATLTVALARAACLGLQQPPQNLKLCVHQQTSARDVLEHTASKPLNMLTGFDRHTLIVQICPPCSRKSVLDEVALIAHVG